MLLIRTAMKGMVINRFYHSSPRRSRRRAVPRYLVVAVNKLNSEIGMVAVVRAIASSMGLPKPSVVDVPSRVVENATT